MKWKEIIKGDAWEMEQEYGMRSAEIVDMFTSGNEEDIEIRDGDEYIDFEYDSMNHMWHYSGIFHSKFEEDSKLGKWFKAAGREIVEDDIKEAIKLGFEVEGYD
jgi:hypothetical protein